MQGRICPYYFTRWYSSDNSTVWKCENCGNDIPVPKENNSMEAKSMEQTFIAVYEGSTQYNIDIRESTQAERFDYYNKISKGQVIKILEKIGKFDTKILGGRK